MIADALTRANCSQSILLRKKQGGISYYCPSRYALDDAVPKDQRFKASGVPIRDIAVSAPTNCKWIKSVVQRGRKFARKQPEINIKMALGVRANGVNWCKMTGLLEGSMGIKNMNCRSQKYIDLKIRGAIGQLFNIRQHENLGKHVTACELMPGKQKIKFEFGGMDYVATMGPGSMDGVGKKRSYNHRINGDKTALVVQSGAAKVPLTIVHSQNKCIHCTNAINKQIQEAEERGEEITAEDLHKFSSKHSGECWRKTSYSFPDIPFTVPVIESDFGFNARARGRSRTTGWTMKIRIYSRQQPAAVRRATMFWLSMTSCAILSSSFVAARSSASTSEIFANPRM